MQLKSNKMFPYPVLWEEKDDYINNNAFELKIAHYFVGNKTMIEATINLVNEEVLGLVNNGKACIICHVECPKTKYRNCFELHNGINELEIHSNQLNGKVEIVSVIQTISDISDYRNYDFSNKFGKIRFDIPKNSIIAISSHYNIPIEKDLDSLANISSIVSIIPLDDNGKDMQVSCENPAKIYVKLPQKAYLNYSAISKTEKYNPIVFSLIIVPALVHVFNYIINQGDIEMLDDFRWFKGLSKKINDLKDASMTIDYLQKTDLVVLAQRILGDPVVSSFELLMDNGR